jgi:integrase
MADEIMAATTKLTATGVRALVKKPGKYGDGDGLWLHVSKPGRAHWHLHYGPRTGQRVMSLGSVDQVSLAEARELAGAARKLIVKGIDPLDQRREQQAAAEIAAARAVTFAEAVDAYIASHEAGWRNPKHRYQWRATLDRANEVMGSMAVSAIDTDHVLRVLQPIWNEKPETASRLRGRIEMVLSYATVRGWRDRNILNPAVWRGHLQLILPAKRKVRAVQHLAALPWQEAPAFMRALREREGFGVNALMFAILTAARSGEVRGATWDEIDLDGAKWTIPPRRANGTGMKSGNEHRVPLSGPAVAILREMAKLKDGSGLVFLGLKRDVPMSDMTLTAVLRRMGRGDLTAHGFRSTFRDWTGEVTNHPADIAEAALAHTLGDKVREAYQRGDLFLKRRKLMNDWADYLAKPPAQVVALRPGARKPRRSPQVSGAADGAATAAAAAL